MPLRPGQPTKLTPETQRLICEAIEEGASRQQAARAAAVGASTLQRWLADGAVQESGIYREFREAVEGAEERLVQRAAKVMVGFLGPQTSESVRFAAAKFVLERRAPSMWGSRAALTLAGEGGGPVEVKHSGQVEATIAIPWERLGELTPEQLEALGRGVGE